MLTDEASIRKLLVCAHEESHAPVDTDDMNNIASREPDEAELTHSEFVTNSNKIPVKSENCGSHGG